MFALSVKDGSGLTTDVIMCPTGTSGSGCCQLKLSDTHNCSKTVEKVSQMEKYLHFSSQKVHNLNVWCSISSLDYMGVIVLCTLITEPQRLHCVRKYIITKYTDYIYKILMTEKNT